MGIIKKVTNLIRGKASEIGTVPTTTVYGGVELLKRMTSGSWSKGKMLEQYEKSLYVFACVYKIAEKVSSSPVNLFKIINSKGDVTEIQNNPVLDLLYKPNPFQTKNEFLKITMINKKLCGDAFWYKVRNERGKVTELWNLRPDYMEIIKDPEEFIKAYKLNKTDGSSEYFDPNDIVHFKYPTPLDDYFGTSPVKSAQTRIDTESYAGQYQRDFFLNNARPDGILKIKSGVALSQEDKDDMREEFERKHKGVGRNSKIAVVEGDLEYQQVSISQREMDFIESMKFTRDDILVAFGVPKAVVAITDDVNRANAETAMHIFLSEVVKPELDMFDDKINEELIAPDFDDTLFIRFPDPTPENREQLVKEYETGLKNSYLLINEVRAKENMEPIEGGWALYKPIGEVPVGGLTGNKAKELVDMWYKRKSQEEADRKLKIFRGKDMLHKKLILKEKLVEELKKKFVKEPPAKKLKEAKANDTDNTVKELSALIKGDLREKYANMIIKQIDNRAARLKTDITKLAQRQGDDLLIKLGKQDITKSLKSKSKATKLSREKYKGVGKETNNLLKDFYSEQSVVFAEFVFPFIEEYARSAGLEAITMINPDKGFEVTAALRKALTKRAEKFGLGVNKTTREKVTRAIADGLDAGEGLVQISDRVNGVYKEFPTWRSDLIARTESTAANNEGTLEAYKQSEVATHKEWIATMDERTRPEHMALDGEIVKVNDSFSNGLKYPQEPNCRCVIGPAFEK